MGFAPQGLWVTGYRGLMGYGVQIPAHQLGGPKKAWDFRGYGLSEAWVMGVTHIVQTIKVPSMTGRGTAHSTLLAHRKMRRVDGRNSPTYYWRT
jgi:hypothetical protein